MSILKKLNIDIKDNSIVSVLSKAAQGKTTLLTYLVKELNEGDKNILVISDGPEKLWLRRLKNLLPNFNKKNMLIVKQLSFGSNYVGFLNKVKEVHPEFDCLIFDSFCSEDESREIIEYARQENLLTFISGHMVTTFFTPYHGSHNIRKSLADVIISVTKHNTDTPLKDKINKFFKKFGIILFKRKNVKIVCLKNRYGKDSSELEYFFDYEFLNKNYEKN
jgi:energy-coupling factor transporter ATP-binding protein EcfA2